MMTRKSLLLPLLLCGVSVNAFVATHVPKQKEALHRTYQSFVRQSHKSLRDGQALLSDSWWAFPMTLCLVPVICKFMLNMDATTPAFWKMVDMQFVHSLPHGAATVGAFLFSNIAYFMSGLYLLLKSTSQSIKTTTLGRLSDSRLPQIQLPPLTRTSALGYWILAAGLISTLFHSVQALGDYTVAESWCYLDHGIAISAGLYFWKVCGPPAKHALSFGVPGLVCLAVTPQAAYTCLHSVWHFLSAGAAVAWGLQAYSKDDQRVKLELAFLMNDKLRQNIDDDNNAPSET
ncbi:hypothetical protein MPSEU_000778000 [Mayamaea pseudoterrestris]|nr:hypothetical protein MPSEU_000778000 [Mayamaea pseudoterrestris]